MKIHKDAPVAIFRWQKPDGEVEIQTLDFEQYLLWQSILERRKEGDMKGRDVVNAVIQYTKDHPDKVLLWGAIALAFFVGYALG